MGGKGSKKREGVRSGLDNKSDHFTKKVFIRPYAQMWIHWKMLKKKRRSRCL